MNLLKELNEADNKNGWGIYSNFERSPVLLAGPFPDKKLADDFAKKKNVPINNDKYTIQRIPKRSPKFMDNTGSMFD